MKVGDDGVERPFVRRSALPRLTLYAHGDVVRTLRVIAAEDGCQVQVVLRQAVSDYLAVRGHRFTDLVIGK